MESFCHVFEVVTTALSRLPDLKYRSTGYLSILSLLSVGLLAIGSRAKEAPNSSTPKSSVKSTVLFMDWSRVFKGRWQPTIDPTRASESGKKAIAGLQSSWGVEFDTNGHGLVPYQSPHGIRIAIEKARKEPFELKADRPWEERINGPSILREGKRLRCWYSAVLPKENKEIVIQEQRTIEVKGQALCYAESEDGIHWLKPNLGIYSFNGSKENNIVSFAHVIAAVFCDEHGPPAERYKSFEFTKLPAEELGKVSGGNFESYCLTALVSPDGYHWKALDKPLIRDFCDTQNVAAWDPRLKKYVGYFRDHRGGRAISRAETDDFHDWPQPQPILVPAPEDGPDDDYYTNCYTTYPGNDSLRLLFPAIYHQGNDRVDVRMALSKEGAAYSWVSHQPIIELGAPGEFDSATIYASPNLIRRSDGKLALAYLGSSSTHNDAFFFGFYSKYTSQSALGWAVWDDGRLAGIEAEGRGEFYTQPFNLDGNQIEINSRMIAEGGKLAVEVLQRGQPQAGLTLAESVPVQDDSMWIPLRWKDKVDLSEFTGKKIQLHLILDRAKVFGYRTVANPALASAETR
jgi:hypothetical protein